jgi:transcriptional regulator with XRE-family HTH domain
MYTSDVRKKQTDKETTDLGRFLYQWRIDKNLTVEEAADQAGFSKSIWTKLENGQKTIGLETLFALAQLTGRTMDDLYAKLGKKVHQSKSSEDRGHRMAALAEVEPKAAALIDLLPDLSPGQIDTMLTVGESLHRKDQK